MNDAPFPVHSLVELHVTSFETIKDYYQKMGFEVVWERPPEGFKGYLVIKLDHNVFCFWVGNEHVFKQAYFSQFPHDSTRGYGVELVLLVDDIDAYYEQVKALPMCANPSRRVHGMYETLDVLIQQVTTYDFTGKHNILDKSNAVT